jgi:hypothetical protein
MSLCPVEIPHDLNWVRARAAKVGNRLLIAWATARPVHNVNENTSGPKVTMPRLCPKLIDYEKERSTSGIICPPELVYRQAAEIVNSDKAVPRRNPARSCPGVAESGSSHSLSKEATSSVPSSKVSTFEGDWRFQNCPLQKETLLVPFVDSLLLVGETLLPRQLLQRQKHSRLFWCQGSVMRLPLTLLRSLWRSN